MAVLSPRAGDILISPDYFGTVGIPIVRGRAFSEQDAAGSPPVVIVSSTLASQVFPGEDPIGRRIRLDERMPMTCCATDMRVRTSRNMSCSTICIYGRQEELSSLVRDLLTP